MSVKITVCTFALACLAILMHPLPAESDTLRVGPGGDDGYRNLVDAIDAAADGDEIVVADGLYTGRNNRDLYFNGKVIVLRSANGPANCIIDCQENDPAFVFDCESPKAVLQGFTFTNGANDDGGAIEINQRAPIIRDCIFRANYAAQDGGAIHIGPACGDVTLINCHFYDNEARDDGGALAKQGAGTLLLYRCLFASNQGRDNGGAVFCRDGEVTVVACAFHGNVARSTGAGMYNRENEPIIVNSIFSGNHAHDFGGGLYNRQTDTSPRLLHCTFYGNIAGLEGGGLCNAADQRLAQIRGCILWGNRDESGDGLAAQVNGALPEVYTSCIQGWTVDDPSRGNTAADPLCLDPDGPDNVIGTIDDNLHLAAGSPCVDAAALEVVAPPLTSDAQDQARVRGDAIDMGALEFQPSELDTPPVADDILTPPVIVTEVLNHSGGGPDWVELYNRSNEPVHVGGWLLSDDPGSLRKYEIAMGTWIDPNGYLVLSQDLHFGNGQDPGTLLTFGFSSSGEEICLSSATAGILTGYRQVHMLPGAPRGVANARCENSLGVVDFMLTQANTPGADNTGIQIGPVIISEVMYSTAPAGLGGQYVELWNVSDAAVVLAPGEYDESYRLWTGTEYVFPSDPAVALAPNGRVLIARDPDALRAAYPTIPEGTIILGPFEGTLPDNYGLVEFQRFDVGAWSHLCLDRIAYNTDGTEASCDKLAWRPYWPVEAYDQGMSLTRIDATVYGNEPTNWQAAEPTPGY